MGCNTLCSGGKPRSVPGSCPPAPRPCGRGSSGARARSRPSASRSTSSLCLGVSGSQLASCAKQEQIKDAFGGGGGAVGHRSHAAAGSFSAVSATHLGSQTACTRTGIQNGFPCINLHVPDFLCLGVCSLLQPGRARSQPVPPSLLPKGANRDEAERVSPFRRGDPHCDPFPGRPWGPSGPPPRALDLRPNLTGARRHGFRAG